MPYAYDPATGEAEATGDSTEARRYNAARGLARAARVVLGAAVDFTVQLKTRMDLAAALVAWDACQEPSLLEAAARKAERHARNGVAQP